MKPHTFQPTRIGFFFREADGSVHASASYREEVLDAAAGPAHALRSACRSAVERTLRRDAPAQEPASDPVTLSDSRAGARAVAVVARRYVARAVTVVEPLPLSRPCSSPLLPLPEPQLTPARHHRP